MDTNKRMLAFLIGCIGTRSAIAYAAKIAPPAWLMLMGFLALVPAIGFITIYVMKWRQTGVEVGGGKIWWNALRPFHALMWLLFAISAIARNPNAWIILFLDVLVGLTAFVLHHSGVIM